MKQAIIAAAVAAYALTAHAQLKDGVVAVQETEAVVTVTKVDKQKRTVTFRGPRGGAATITVPPESQNLDRVSPGQQYKITYVEAVAVAIRAGGPASAGVAESVKLAPKGLKPGGVVARAVQVTGVLDGIDYTNRYVALRGPKGNVAAFKVSDDVQLDKLSAGDRVTVVYTEAMAIEMAEKRPLK
jgi:hypothetical protein